MPTYYNDLIEIVGKNKGHIIGSSACLGGFLPKKILQHHSTPNADLYNNILKWCKNMVSLFGEGNFVLELQPSAYEEQEIVNKELLKISEQLNIPYIITTDSHYLKKEDAKIHEAYINSQDGDREASLFYATTYMMGTEELESYFSYFTKEQLNIAYQNIINIKNACEDYSLLKSLKIPSLQWKIPEARGIKDFYRYKMPTLNKFIESDFDGDRIMAQAIINKIEDDPRLQNEETYAEVEDNLIATWRSSEVNKTHWSAYFLNLQQIIEVCWNAGTLVGPARGSGGGFILLYLLDIIQINPLWETTKCFSWRFLNPERVSVLDIDTDIEGGRRAQVLQALRDFYGEDRVANVITFGTEGSKSAIQTGARGLGIDNDIATYLASLIPSERGATYSLKEAYYGDEEKGIQKVPQFRYEMENNYPELWKVAQRIEGLISRVGEHAGGVIFVDEEFTKSTALMRVPNGDIVTQFDLHDCEKCSLIKIDLLSVECLDKIHNCIDLLTKYGYAEKKATLKETYENIIGIYNLERDDPKMWQMVWDHKINSLFQMEQGSGLQGISLIHPKNVNDLSVLNSVIRLMASEKGGEQPLVMWARYRKNINVWIKEMKKYGLTDDEINWLSHHNAITDGICESQEGLMSLVQEEKLGGNSLTFADKCRKGIAKKQGSLFQECEETYYKNIAEKGCSQKLAHYVWDVLLKVQRGYSFNRAHCLAYSLVALQEMNLCYKYPIIFWNCACLMSDSGGEDGGTDYDKIAVAMSKMIKAGIKINLPDINKADFGFIPDVENNQILYGMKGLSKVGDELIKNIIAYRPYNSIEDFIDKVGPTRQSMISLIKSGAFDNLKERVTAMKEYVYNTADIKQKVNLQNIQALIKYNLMPDTDDGKQCYQLYEFNRYIKSQCKYDNEYYCLDDRAIQYLDNNGYGELLVCEDGKYLLNIKIWNKVYQKKIIYLKDWLIDNQEQILNQLNNKIFQEDWDKYCQGTTSTWEMDSMCFYHGKHELADINNKKYGFIDYYTLPEEPQFADGFNEDSKFKRFKTYKICGTCIAKNKNHSTVSLLTPTGVVEIKFQRDVFSLFNKKISHKRPDGTKQVIETSWFDRGSMIAVQGYRRDDNFIPKKYSSTGGHLLYKIDKVYDNGDLELRSTRLVGDIEEDE